MKLYKFVSLEHWFLGSDREVQSGGLQNYYMNVKDTLWWTDKRLCQLPKPCDLHRIGLEKKWMDVKTRKKEKLIKGRYYPYYVHGAQHHHRAVMGLTGPDSNICHSRSNCTKDYKKQWMNLFHIGRKLKNMAVSHINVTSELGNTP